MFMLEKCEKKKGGGGGGQKPLKKCKIIFEHPLMGKHGSII